MGFLSNPRRIHSKEKEEEKGEQGVTKGSYLLLNDLPLPLPPHTRTARLLDCLGLRYQDTSPPPPKYIHTGQNQWFLRKAAKKYDSLFLETQEGHGWIRAAFVILYKLEWKW
jgi:hypothetical protein